MSTNANVTPQGTSPTLPIAPTTYDHGITYLPSTSPHEASLTVGQFSRLKIPYVRIQWVDITGLVRCRILPASYFLNLLNTARPGISIPKSCMGLVYLSIAPGFTCCGEYLYLFDLSTLRVCPYAPGEAVVMGWLQEKAPYLDVNNKLTLEVPICPRAVLHRVVQKASDAGINFLVGFESEFIFLQSTSPVVATRHSQYSSSDGLLAGSLDTKVLKEVADGIQQSGIELQTYHNEGAPGQYEMVTGPLGPLEAADALIQTREVIINVASKYGLRATFAPRIHMDSAGSATHTHISVHAKDTAKTPEELSPQESSFLSSVLTNLPALTALTMPIPASYKRMEDGVFSGGTYINWGTENREAPIRLANARSPSSRNFEMRYVDGTANPYFALAGILGIGLAGILDKVPLKIKDCQGPLPAAQMTEEDRQKLGITQRMSLTWEEARQRFAENELLTKTIMGPELTEKYLAVHKKLADSLDMDGQDEAAILSRLVKFF